MIRAQKGINLSFGQACAELKRQATSFSGDYTDDLRLESSILSKVF
jgi:hypothetical protein